MTTVSDSTADRPAQSAPPAIERFPVGWVASPTATERFGQMLRQMVVGMMDELVDLSLARGASVSVAPVPSPPVEVITYAERRWLGPPRSAVEQVAQSMRARRVRLIHALDAPSCRLARRLSDILGIPFVVGAYQLGDAKRLRLADEASAVLAGSEPIRQELVESRVAGADRIHLLRPGTYADRHANCFSGLDSSVSLVVGGELDSVSHFQPVLEAFARLRQQELDCALFIVGSGRAEKALRQNVEKLQLRHDITFVDQPSASQLMGIFRAADIYVAPVPTDHVDMVTLLAMGAGIPVVATAGGASDFLVDEQTAKLCQSGSSEELSSKLASLINERASARALTENALGYLREHHSPSAMVSKLADIYRDVIAR
jgi:glycosyltransferase involved in cell wall biosynthesis